MLEKDCLATLPVDTSKSARVWSSRSSARARILEVHHRVLADFFVLVMEALSQQSLQLAAVRAWKRI